MLSRLLDFLRSGNEAADGAISRDPTTSRRSAERDGLFLVVVGPDGVGKTTVARRLLESYPGPVGYFHFRPRLSAPLRRLPPLIPGRLPEKHAAAGPVFLSFFRLIRNFALFWLTYLVRVRPSLRKGALVVGDRWAYGYLAQPKALKYQGSQRFAQAITGMLPTPDLVVNLTATAKTIRQRKQELSHEEIVAELEVWRALPVPNLRHFSTERHLEDVVAEIWSELGRSRDE